MDTKEQLSILSEICRQDLKLISNKDNLSRLNQENIIATKAAENIKSNIVELENKKFDLLKQRKNLDEKLQQERANVRKWEARAEKIRGERDYAALSSEIGSQKRTISGIEFELANIMQDMSKIDEELKQKNLAYEEKSKEAEKAFTAVDNLLSEANCEIEKNQQVRLLMLAKIPTNLRVKYERIYDKKAKQGVALLKDSICQACMRKIPAELFMKISKCEIIEQCPSCQRILVADNANTISFEH